MNNLFDCGANGSGSPHKAGMTGKILILGKNGQVGRALCHVLGSNALSFGANEIDLRDGDFTAKLDEKMGAHSISAVINAAAYTLVDKAQQEGKENCFRINADAVGELAAWCKKRALPLVHYSTDYVFDGTGNTPRREIETPHPINLYGASKLAGEQAIEAVGGQYLILRTSWVYDGVAKNFFTTIRKLLQEKETLRVVTDQIGAPTYAGHLAQATLEVIATAQQEKLFPSGLYHLCNAGHTSWYGFAKAIWEQEKSHEKITCREILPIQSADYPLPAPRPLNSRLDCDLIKERLGIVMPQWEEGLAACFEILRSRPARLDAH